MSRLFRMSDTSDLEGLKQGLESLQKTANKKSQPEAEIVIKHASRLREVPALDESGLTRERKIIEVCAEKHIPYAYHTGWTEDVVSSLREYAAITGCSMFGVDPSEVKTEKAPETIKTASAASPERTSSLNIGDAFNIESAGDMEHMSSESWEQLFPSAKFNDPKMAMWAGSVTKIGGGEDYEASPHMRTKPGQNSVTDPDAIGKLARNEVPDIAAGLREHAEARSKNREISQHAAEAKLAKDMRDSEHWAGQNGTIRLTETLTAQPGIRDGKAMPGVFQTEATSIPERTAGETLHAKAEEKKASIQRDRETDDRKWDHISTTRSARMSDTLDGLEAELKKNASKDNKGIMSFSDMIFPDTVTEQPEAPSTEE